MDEMTLIGIFGGFIIIIFALVVGYNMSCLHERRKW